MDLHPTKPEHKQQAVFCFHYLSVKQPKVKMRDVLLQLTA